MPALPTINKRECTSRGKKALRNEHDSHNPHPKLRAARSAVSVEATSGFSWLDPPDGRSLQRSQGGSPWEHVVPEVPIYPTRLSFMALLPSAASASAGVPFAVAIVLIVSGVVLARF